jgi:hypothetical protein
MLIFEEQLCMSKMDFIFDTYQAQINSGQYSSDLYRAAIQRRGYILTWIIILFVYSADTIAEGKLLISPFLR